MTNKTLVLFILVLFIGCTKESHLIIHNDAPQMVEVKVDGQIYPMLENCEPVNITYYLNSYLLIHEKEKIPVTYSGSLFIKPQDFKVTMKPGEDKHLYVLQDRAAIEITNISYFIHIYQILLREDSISVWSDNVLENMILPESTETFPVSPQNTQLKIIDNYSNEYPIIEVELTAGQYTNISFSGN